MFPRGPATGRGDVVITTAVQRSSVSTRFTTKSRGDSHKKKKKNKNVIDKKYYRNRLVIRVITARDGNSQLFDLPADL